MRTRSRSRGTSESGLSAVLAFFVSLGILFVAGAVFLLTAQTDSRPLPAPYTPAPDSPSPTLLTEAEAEAIFEQLNGARIKAYERRQADYLAAFLSDSSPLWKVARQEVSQLRRDNLRPRITDETVEVTLVRATPERLVLERVSEQSIRVLNADGRDVGKKKGTYLREIRWTLVFEHGWKIHNSKFLSEERIRR